MIPYLALAVLGAPLTLFLHESAHALTTLALGGTVLQFRPYPHKLNGIRYLGRVRRLLELKHAHYEAISPLVKAIVLSALYVTLAVTVWSPFVCLAFWEIVDASWWLLGLRMSERTDANRFVRYIREQKSTERGDNV